MSEQQLVNRLLRRGVTYQVAPFLGFRSFSIIINKNNL